MVLGSHQQARTVAAVPAGGLPPRMRVLHIAAPRRTGAWLAEALAADGASQIELEESVGGAAGLARLRDEVFDAVLVSHEPPDLDALALIEGLRGSGSEDALLVLGAASEPELAALSFEAGADAYLCVTTATTRTLIWLLARAVERHRLVRENRRLAQADQRRLQHEHQEAECLLEQQRALIRDLEALRQGISADSPAASRSSAKEAGLRPVPEPLPPQLVAHYRELLRAYVMMGAGNLAAEMATLAQLLTAARITARQTMQLHLHVLEEMVRGLGSRSARHVMTRADLLALEVMMHLAEGYRQRFEQQIHPPQQLTLPGFEPLAA